MSRVAILSTEIRNVLCEFSGQEPSGLPEDVAFLDMGFDSLVLTQVALAASKRFKVPLKLRDFLEDHSTVASLASHLDRVVPAGVVANGAASQTVAQKNEPVQTPLPVAPSPPSAAQAPPARPKPSMALPSVALGPEGRGTVASLISAQLALMARQLELLGATGATASISTSSAQLATTVETPTPVETTTSAPETPVNAETPTAASPPSPTRHGPQLVIDKNRTSSLTPTQERHLANLCARYAERTAKSKAFTQRNRVRIADPRVPAGFKPTLKELVYPIVVERSSGCRLWDLDGNEYIDMLNGYGSNFFGFGAPFVKDAIREQLDLGMEIGPQTPLIEEVCDLFRKLVAGADRVAFCNTGSEAVLATFRLARTVTGRDKVVMFQGGYHGIFDEVVARGLPGGRSLPAAPGIPRPATENLVILEWGAEQSIDWLRANGEEVAAVLVEPVQSRRPELQPIEFLKTVRSVTEQAGIALIFDEVVTGFRVAPGGAQELFGIRADLASYGKVLGGGLSIGIIAGKREFMDALDGGMWSFGDDSIPEVGVTYFAGTFVRHPIHLAAARAVLRHLVDQGPALQKRVSENTTKLASELNSLFKREGAPLELRHFSSIIKIATTEPIPLGEILFVHLRERGIHAWEGRPCFFTDAHRQEDMNAIVKAFAEAIQELQESGFYPRRAHVHNADHPPVAGARLGRDAAGKPAWFVADPSNPGRFVQVASTP